VTLRQLTAALAERGATQAEIEPNRPLRLLVNGEWLELSAPPSRRTVEDMIYHAAPEQLQLGWPTRWKPLQFESNDYAVEVWQDADGPRVRFVKQLNPVAVPAKPNAADPAFQPRQPATPRPAIIPRTSPNTSGTGWGAKVPESIGWKLNFGACFAPVSWCFAHNVWYFALGFMALYGLILSLFPYRVPLQIAGVCFLVLSRLLGIFANQIAWKNRKFEDETEFQLVQMRWRKFGRFLSTLYSVVFFALVILLIEDAPLRVAVGTFLRSMPGWESAGNATTAT